uniref:Vacuolar protein sorting 13 homolog A n=1 Tax=Cairina moschata TaxID=8855 RepID=A0A8C3CU79_CAIMO
MVFESLVVDVLNRFLGDYVVNLDSSQLKLGIWGGAGRQLDVPFKVKAGHIGQLNLQIPWQNLYTQPVEAILDGVYLLIVPTASIKYDAEKEARQLLEARQRELQRIEEAKQKIADQDKVKEEKQDTFVEKLVTQVIKNLQVKISNIHVRYEDDVSNFVYLKIRRVHCNIKLGTCFPPPPPLLFVLVRLDNLFAYWNVKSEMFYHGGYDESLVSKGVYYSIFRPISAKAKLLMNPRSDVDFSSPKMDLNVKLEDIAVEFNKPQYFSVMELLESVDMMTRNLPYRKYRPDVPLHNNAKMWWKYVIYGILEVNVQPKLQMWSWEHIRHHRKQVKNYKEMYKTKITSKKPNEEILKFLEVSNFTLKIVFNLLCIAGLEQLMTLEEKAKLYAAIGYSETAVDPTLPKSYEAMKLSLNLLSMSISIRENKRTPELVKFTLDGLSTVFTQRPGAQAIRFETKVTSLEVMGTSRENCTPCLLSSRTVYSDNSTSLLSIAFETNPLDEKADQRLRIESQPLEIVYDARTINSLVDFFRPPKNVHLEQLTSATLMKLEEFREKTSTGLLYVIETQKVLDLKINLMASYIIVPQKGFYDSTSNLLLLDLGSLKVLGQSTIEDIMSRAYDSFDIQLRIFFAPLGENWQEARKLKCSSQHILQPLDVKVEFSRAMVVTDARMPKFKLYGQLPLLSVQISDQKLKSILELIDSIPKPESASTTSPPKVTEVRFLKIISSVLITKINSLLLTLQLLNEQRKMENKHLLRTFQNLCSVFLPKALYITGKEVFNFKMISYVNATDGIAYANMDVVDNSMSLTVGCIQVVFVNKFVSSILAFINNFQAAKEALTEATVQAAEKAATGVKELAERSSRLALDINIKAPVVIVPQSAVSANVLVADLGLITVKNQFFIAKSKSWYNLPPVVDSITVNLSELKSYYEQDTLQSEVQLLQPLNLEVVVERNLAAAWYTEAPDIEISGRLKPMNVSVTVVTSAVVELHSPVKIKTTLKLDFRFDSLTLVLYSPNSKQVTNLDQRDDLLKLAEFKLVLMSAAVKMLSDGSMNASVKLANCTLDDKRQSIQKATPRSVMVEMKHGFEKKVMVDISYKQGRDGTVFDMIVQEIYLCASMEFLLTVADIFLKANAETPVQPVSTMEMNIIVKNPEIVFVADLTRSDAPALVVTTQCEVFIKNSPERYSMTAAVKEIQVKACPFLPEKRKGNVTTVLQPCDFFFEMKQSGTKPQSADLMIKSLTVKVSPIIINTVITITSALYRTAETTEEEISQIPPDLWNMKDVKNLKMWFLEESNENEDSNPTSELVPTGESLKMSIESLVLTLEAGVGHRTVPMLLAKSSFLGEVKNWSTLINLHSQLELEVHYFNEMFGVWEPLLEPLEIEKTDLFKPWILEIKAFAEAASQTSDIFKKDRAPFVLINSLGLPITVSPSDSFSVLNVEFGAKIFYLVDGENLNMEYVRTKNESDQVSFLTLYVLDPHNHSTVEKIPLTKVGRCIYRVRHEESGVERSIVCQIDTVEGSKIITIRSPIQIRNHFSIPFNIFEEGRCLGTASPENEFNIPLSAYRYIIVLFVLFLSCNMFLHCQSTNHSFIINIVIVKDTLTSTLCADDQWDFPYVVHLWPSVLLRNLLPYHINYSVEVILQFFHFCAQIHNAVLDQTKLDLQLLNYLDQNWKSEYHVKSNLPEISFTTFYCITELDKTELDIAVHVTYTTGQMVIAIHSPYWMVNKTGRMLQYKADGIHRKHPPDYKKPLLFSFQPKNFFQNNKVQLMVTDSELSDQFSLDTVGSHGSVKCKSHKKEYQVGVTINNSSFNITRIVTFTPFFMISNRSKYTLEVAEEGKEKWIPIVLQQCIPFWPENDANKLLVRVENSDLPPKKINFDKQENCLLLHLDNKLGGIIVDVNLTEHSTVITFSNYHDGAAPFLLINHTEEEIIEYGQSSLSQLEGCLQPNKAVLYTWADPAGSRKLTWKCGKITEEITPKEVLVYLASFFEGLQRIVLITEDENVFKLAYESIKAELAEQEIILSLQDVGISLVNNYTKQEVCLTPNGCNMKIQQPNEIPIRRNYLPALKVEYSSSAHQKSFRIQVYRIQIQNQIPGAIFPFVFYPIKPPKSITLDSGLYFKVLIQEMDLRLDLGFLYALVEFFTQTDVPNGQQVETFCLKMNRFLICNYSTCILKQNLQEQLHLSFSLSTGGEDSNKEERKNELIPLQSLNLLLKSIGATLTDVQDVVFKLAFFELNYHFCTTQQLQSAVLRHYSKQAIKQMYVLILGLDVLGNPFGFIRDLSEGVEAFFYEPYQGAIQGPEEFVEGMALGLKALVGGAVGGLAGAASRITGAMAKGVAAITMDEDYQQKRREAMNKQPTGLREGITRGGKGLGFVSGITGIVTKPIRGAQKEGAAGFFKGVGKGLVGAVARPTGGIIDMASSTFQGIKKVADSSEDVVSLRPPRFFGEDGVIRPYRLRDGTGSQMLQVKKWHKF